MGLWGLKSKREEGECPLTVRPWRLSLISHTLFSSCFSQAASDWAPNKAGHHKSLTALSCWSPRWVFRTLFISNQQNKISANEVTAPSWPWEALGCVWVSVDRLPEQGWAHPNPGTFSEPSAASKNPETGQVPSSVGLHENCLLQTTCRSHHKQDDTKQSWLPKHQVHSKCHMMSLVHKLLANCCFFLAC